MSRFAFERQGGASLAELNAVLLVGGNRLTKSTG